MRRHKIPGSGDENERNAPIIKFAHVTYAYACVIDQTKEPGGISLALGTVSVA